MRAETHFTQSHLPRLTATNFIAMLKASSSANGPGKGLYDDDSLRPRT